MGDYQKSAAEMLGKKGKGKGLKDVNAGAVTGAMRGRAASLTTDPTTKINGSAQFSAGSESDAQDPAHIARSLALRAQLAKGQIPKVGAAPRDVDLSKLPPKPALTTPAGLGQTEGRFPNGMASPAGVSATPLPVKPMGTPAPAPSQGKIPPAATGTPAPAAPAPPAKPTTPLPTKPVQQTPPPAAPAPAQPITRPKPNLAGTPIVGAPEVAGAPKLDTGAPLQPPTMPGAATPAPPAGAPAPVPPAGQPPLQQPAPAQTPPPGKVVGVNGPTGQPVVQQALPPGAPTAEMNTNNDPRAMQFQQNPAIAPPPTHMKDAEGNVTYKKPAEMSVPGQETVQAQQAQALAPLEAGANKFNEIAGAFGDTLAGAYGRLTQPGLGGIRNASWILGGLQGIASALGDKTSGAQDVAATMQGIQSAEGMFNAPEDRKLAQETQQIKNANTQADTDLKGKQGGLVSSQTLTEDQQRAMAPIQQDFQNRLALKNLSLAEFNAKSDAWAKEYSLKLQAAGIKSQDADRIAAQERAKYQGEIQMREQDTNALAAFMKQQAAKDGTAPIDYKSYASPDDKGWMNADEQKRASTFKALASQHPAAFAYTHAQVLKSMGDKYLRGTPEQQQQFAAWQAYYDETDPENATVRGNPELAAAALAIQKEIEADTLERIGALGKSSMRFPKPGEGAKPKEGEKDLKKRDKNTAPGDGSRASKLADSVGWPLIGKSPF